MNEQIQRASVDSSPDDDSNDDWKRFVQIRDNENDFDLPPGLADMRGRAHEFPLGDQPIPPSLHRLHTTVQSTPTTAPTSTTADRPHAVDDADDSDSTSAYTPEARRVYSPLLAAADPAYRAHASDELRRWREDMRLLGSDQQSLDFDDDAPESEPESVPEPAAKVKARRKVPAQFCI